MFVKCLPRLTLLAKAQFGFSFVKCCVIAGLDFICRADFLEAWRSISAVTPRVLSIIVSCSGLCCRVTPGDRGAARTRQVALERLAVAEVGHLALEPRRLRPPRLARENLRADWRVVRGTLGSASAHGWAVLNRCLSHNRWAVRHASGECTLAVLDLHLRAPDDVVDAAADVLDLVLTVQVALDGLIGVDKVLELLLQAVVLIVQICHVLVERINLTTEVALVMKHLV